MKYRVALIIVQNSKGEFYMHQRAPHKWPYPNLYSFGAGGKIEQAETPEQGAKRELREELGITPDLKFLYKYFFEDDQVRHWMYIFYAKYEGPFEPCNEFQWTGWMTKAEVDKLYSQNNLCPDTREAYERLK